MIILKTDKERSIYLQCPTGTIALANQCIRTGFSPVSPAHTQSSGNRATASLFPSCSCTNTRRYVLGQRRRHSETAHVWCLLMEQHPPLGRTSEVNPEPDGASTANYRLTGENDTDTSHHTRGRPPAKSNCRP